MEKFFLKRLFLFNAIAAIAFLSGCSPPTDGSASRANIDGYSIVLNTSFSEVTSSGLEGTGAILFNAPLSSVNSHESLRLSAELIGPASTLTIVTNASTPQLLDGNWLTFTANGISLGGSIRINGSSPVTLDASKLNLFTALSFSMTLDFDDLGSSLRLLIWNSIATFYTAATADFDSLLNSPPFPTGSGPGVYAGLILTNARVNKAQWVDSVLSL